MVDKAWEFADDLNFYSMYTIIKEKLISELPF